MQQGDNRIGVLKVFRTKSSNYKPGNHNLPMIFMVRFKKGGNPQYTSYKVMREQFPQLLLDYFENRIVLRDAQGLKDVENGQYQPFIGFSDNYREIAKQQPIKELKNTRNMKSRKLQSKSPKKELSSKEIQLSADSRPLRYSRFRNQQAKQELRIRQQENESNQISQSLQQSQEQLNEKANPQTQAQYKKILDYDHLIEESACLNLVSPAVIPPIKPKQDLVVPTTMAYQLPPRINFKEPLHEQYSSQVLKDSDQSEFQLDQRGKEKRRKQKMLAEQQNLIKKKKVKKLKKKAKGKGKNKS